jgi:hypothetical protein
MYAISFKWQPRCAPIRRYIHIYIYLFIRQSCTTLTVLGMTYNKQSICMRAIALGTADGRWRRSNWVWCVGSYVRLQYCTVTRTTAPRCLLASTYYVQASWCVQPSPGIARHIALARIALWTALASAFAKQLRKATVPLLTYVRQSSWN